MAAWWNQEFEDTNIGGVITVRETAQVAATRCSALLNDVHRAVAACAGC
jgi:hypothetical protein